MSGRDSSQANGAATPPVLILAPPRFVGPLGVIRSLRSFGVRVYVARTRERSLGRTSRFCAGAFDVGVEGRPVGSDETILAQLRAAAGKLGPGAILLAGSDEWAVFVATHAEALAPFFSFPRQDVALVASLASKDGLYDLATAHGVPTPRIARPADLSEAGAMADELAYPVMLKPILSRPGRQSVSIASNRESLLQKMRELDEPGNVLCQEYIPGTDADVWIFNGYFDAQSRCLAAFTGRKLRQHPAHMGLCALGEYVHNPEVIEITTSFLRDVGYTGIVDIGYRWDRRDGKYKVLDINPRLGGAFRLFVDANGLDVSRACYLDLTGQPVPAIARNDGRRWVLEAADIIALKHYRRDDGFRWGDWLRSFRGVQEGATFSATDPMPFVAVLQTLAADTFAARWQRIRTLAKRAGSPRYRNSSEPVTQTVEAVE